MPVAIAITVLTALSLAVVIVGWTLSERLRKLALRPTTIDPTYNLQFVDVQDGRCTLRQAPGVTRSVQPVDFGVWGLEWAGGYAHVGAVLERSEGQATCEFRPIHGRPNPGDLARLDMFAYPADPERAYGMPYRDVSFASPLGEFHAWRIDGDGDAWAIFVHGKDAGRKEGLRLLPELKALGLPALVISYRNDPGERASPDGLHHFGVTEWQELEGAVEYAIAHGAKSVALIGSSMGAAIILSFMYQSRLKDKVKRIVLDSPLLDLDPVVRKGASHLGIIGLFAPVGMLMASLRFGLDWNDFDYVSRADRLNVPILLVHSHDDMLIPIEISQRFARRRPDIVTFLPLDKTFHGCAWNRDPERYGEAVRTFLAPMAGGEIDPGAQVISKVGLTRA